ncbi:TonB-dependent receptor [Occallatibacter riparius]|uniref:Carboxypeptidase regulatory-like domain-containing protein n=1 Tax=Occallatibacter riparius TaxID=1002689 RepID=A0A9J7BV79_9BACT|nr:TonB-dependent receptor [Occallatibacter riparius]UWZ84814.1 carboxypeptidase regulatory-like domain-containing protein [Occallatibacter riparius]
MTKRVFRITLLFLLVLTAVPLHLLAQATASGSVQGTVTDPSAAVVSGAEVTITSVSTDAKRTTTTNATGGYRFDLLPAGKYKLQISSAGFSTVLQNIEILVGQTVTINVGLKPGSTTQTVEVSAESAIIDTAKTSVGVEITPSEVQNLPMVGQDAANLAYLAPGVKQTDSYDPTKNRYAILSVNGDGGRNVNVTVNGVDNKDNTVGGPVMQLPLEAVQEYHISTQRFSAENGRSEGAAINIITKSGSNQFHGSVLGFFRDTNLNTDQKQPNGDGKTTTSSHPDYTRQQFGGSIGGPVKKDRAFLFFAINREREHQNLAEDPSAYAQLVAAAPFFNAGGTKLVDPAAAIPRPFFETRYNGRADLIINPKNSAYLSYSSQANNSNNDQSDGTGDLNNGNFTVNHLQIANFTVNSILNDTTVNTFTSGFQYWNNLIDSHISSPLVTFPNPASFGTNTNVPQQSYQRKWQFKDDFSKVVGKHTFKGGFDYLWNPVEGGFFEFSSTLEIDFSDNPTNINNAYADTFSHPGLVSGMTIANGDPTFQVATKQLGFYGQDDWKVTRHLELSLGLRWDKDFNMIGGSDIKNSRTYKDLKIVNSPISNPYVDSVAHDDNLDFSPRVGFAWDMSGKGNHVLRGGYGMYFGNVFQNIPLFMEQMSNATVFQSVLSLTNSCPVDGTKPCTGDPVPGTTKTLDQWRYGIDPMPTIPPPSTELASRSVGRLMDPHYRNPVTQEFNFGYTWAINPRTAVEAEYVHVLGLHTNKTMNMDQKIPTGTAAGDCCTRPLDPAYEASSIPERVPASVRVDSAIGREHYDGINFSFREQMANRFQVQANYTLAWAYGYGSGGGSFRNYPKLFTAPFASWEWGPSPNDERSHITVSGVVNLPWRFDFAPILQFGTARPFDLTNSSNTLNTGGGTGVGVVVPKATPKDYFAFAGDNAGAQNCFYGLGQQASCTIVPYDPLRGQAFFELDTRLAKSILIKERYNIQLVAQAFNLTNRANYGNNFGNSIGSPDTFNHPVGFIGPSSTIIPRSTWGELGARFSF